MGQVMRKYVLCHMRTTKAQIIRAVWSAPLLFAASIVWYVNLLYPKFQDSSYLSVAEQAGLNLTWSKIPENTFLRDWAQIWLRIMSHNREPKNRTKSYVKRCDEQYSVNTKQSVFNQIFVNLLSGEPINMDQSYSCQCDFCLTYIRRHFEHLINIGRFEFVLPVVYNNS